MRRIPSPYNGSINTSIKYISMELSDCYSSLCPVYKVEIDVDSRYFTFTGLNNVKKIGVHKGRMSSYLSELLVSFIESTPFFSYNASYLSGQPDLQTTTIKVVTRDGRSNAVTFDDLALPPQLIATRLMINYCINRGNWLYN